MTDICVTTNPGGLIVVGIVAAVICAVVLIRIVMGRRGAAEHAPSGWILLGLAVFLACVIAATSLSCI